MSGRRLLLFTALGLLGLAGPAAKAAPNETPALQKEWAAVLARRGDYAGAIRHYQRAVVLAPRDLDARLRLAEVYAWAHDFDRAAAGYKDILALDAGNRRARLGLGRVYRWSHRYPEAEALYREVLVEAPSDLEALRGQSETYALAGDYASSLALLNRALALAPGDVPLLAQKGTVLAWQGRYPEAVKQIEAALQQRPEAAELHRVLGDVSLWRRDFTRAAAAYRRALQLDADSVETALDLATAYESAGRLSAAEQALELALLKAPEHRKARERLQRLRAGSGFDAARALRTAAEALSHAGAPLLLAYVFYRRRHLVSYRLRLYRLAYRWVLPSMAVAWLGALLAERLGLSLWALDLVEPFLLVTLGLAVSSRFFERRPSVALTSTAVLVVGAHPDDIELGAGGLVLRLKEEGARTYALVMSNGEKGADGPAAARPGEAAEAARVLGLDGLTVLGFPDSRLRDHVVDMKEAIEKKIEDLEIGLVVTHASRETHGDHAAVFEAAREAARRCSLVCFESVSAPPDFVPNFFVDITPFLDAKLRAIGRHRTQEEKPYMDPEMIRGRAAHRGLQAGMPYAEAFWVYRWFR